MRARWAVPAALAVVLACAPARAELRARTRDLGAVSPVADYAQWTTATTMTGSTCNPRASDLLTWNGYAITFARSDSTLCCPESDASCCWAGVNEPCIHAPAYQGWASGGAVAGGVEVYGVGQNTALQSETLVTGTAATAPWYQSGSAAPQIPGFAADAAVAPNGTMTADQVDFRATPTAGDYSFLYQGFVASAVPWTASFWARTVSGTGTLNISLNTGATDVSAPCAVSETWTRCTYTRTLAAGTRYFFIGSDRRGGDPAAPALSVYLWGAQLTPTAYPVPYRSTTGTAYSGLASTATTLTVPVALLNKDRFALGISATATGNWATVNTGLLQWGGAYGAANTVSVYTDASAKVAVEVYDGAAGWRRWTADAALSGTGQKRIGVAFNSGLIRVLVDDVEVTGTMSGAGTGLLGALPSTSLVIGTSGSSILRGLDAKVCQANDVPGLKRCLR